MQVIQSLAKHTLLQIKMTEMVYVKEESDTGRVKEEFMDEEDPLMITEGIIILS